MENKDINESVIMKALDWAYDKAINGVPGMSTAQELALDFLNTQTEGINEYERIYNAANSLIRWQNAKAATTGFITGLGGLLTLPVTIPANLGCVFYIQLRMIAAIAHMGGYNVKDDRVQTLAYICLTGSAAADIIKQAGIQIGNKLAQSMLKKMSAQVIKEINKKVGFRLLTKFGEKGVINLGKAIPVIGGLIGGTLDAVSTNTIGNTARDTFISH
jgi:hypothetical protein